MPRVEEFAGMVNVGEHIGDLWRGALVVHK